MKIDSLEPDFKAIVKDILDQVSRATGLHWIVISARRTMAEQAALYNQGRTTKGQIVTKAPAGSSAHNFGLGCDCAPLAKNNDSEIWWNAPSSYWDVYGAYCKEAGMTWGGTFKSITDNPHVEHPRWKEEQKKWQAGEINVA
jgi:peptidoglycan L-alanyl-D-glutamate endopeptidase CwlK